MIRDNEQEVYDLGFLVDDRTDDRARLFSSWQRLEDLDTDEALETSSAGPLPEEAEALRRAGMPEEWYPVETYVE